ncbi:TIGR01777 family oxidoreductase [Aciduricibacillus chroicocephali]|uniref:TIGR01777 family oxidoreductase n=1 Tax=Aciduricibacillus chroicocephali TaxID=3054939 RepID=A0ABY9KX87_9BACI|nr:TIGR01777 family oxidoreductase [Bacillaceae bacterium 44XB]
MNILITGGTGFVGSHIVKLLTSQGHHVYIMTRSPEKHESKGKVHYVSTDVAAEELPRIRAAINLAGASLFGRWTDERKEAILKSRLETTNNLIELFRNMDEKPDVLISASAVGWYGTSDNKIFTEKTTTPGNDFLADVCTKWEAAAKKAEELGIRTVIARFGIVLGTEGALPLMEKPVKLFIGGKIGDGEQWVSWIHVDDLARMVKFCIDEREISGPVNFTAPYPKRNKDFMRTIARVQNRPHWTMAPASLVKLAAGEMSEMVIEGQCVKPAKAVVLGYTFQFPILEAALHNIQKREQNYDSIL